MQALLILMTILLASCGSAPVRYVKVDTPNYERYTHDQKIRVGMTQRELMDMFGAPDKVEYRAVYQQNQFQYYNKIFCQQSRCFVYVRDGVVVSYSYIRQEFDTKVSQHL